MSTPRLPSLAADHAQGLVVLDTQVVLDWLVFRDPGVALLDKALEAGSMRWLTVPAMRAELEQVLWRGVGATRCPDRVAVVDTFDRLSHEVAARQPPDPPLRCRDPDDQMFIDLALAARAQWLFTRDRELLRLARPARARGLTVIRPADWQASLSVAA